MLQKLENNCNIVFRNCINAPWMMNTGKKVPKSINKMFNIAFCASVRYFNM